MNTRLSGWDDTIVALATPPGVGAIGVIRLSGRDALSIANALFPSKDLPSQPTHTLHVGIFGSEQQPLDEVVLSLYKAPRSYTGENVVEISCHGSPFIQQQILAACVDAGARMAKPGEFTQRAFLSGKLDLAQAEAVADLILSNTNAAHKTALNAIRGGFSRTLGDLRDRLLSFSALIELELDFSGEDVAFADRTQLAQLLATAKHQTGLLIDSFKVGNAIRNGVSVAIIGKPNAGKSTLLNALLQDDRAIVSEIAGTTRDTIEEVVNIEGILFRLIDTAGLWEHTLDTIESAGIERSREKMRRSDLVVYLFDVSETTPAELEAVQVELNAGGVPYLLVGNKIDGVNRIATREKFDAIPGIVFIAAKTADHLQELQSRMVGMVLDKAVEAESVIVTNARHFHALQEVHSALGDVTEGLEGGIPSDLLALDIRRCLQYLGEITGEITNEDQLDYIFSKFCIGK
jgi:tRNA modification GTPase